MSELTNPSVVASMQQRTEAVEAAFELRGHKPAEFIKEFEHLAEEKWLPENGARVVARAWTDAAFKHKLMANVHYACF